MEGTHLTKAHDSLDAESTALPLASSSASSYFSVIEHDELVNVPVPDSKSGSKGKMKSKLNSHPTYFFEDGNLLIRVEDVHFKVHRYFFMRDSAPFRQLLKGGRVGRIINEYDVMDAAEHTEPLVLEAMTSLDFERFLSVLYPKRFDEHHDSSSAHWSSVLKVSTSLTFESIRALSIKSLSSVVTPVEKIALSREYGITHWLRDAYHDVCMRKETLTKEEGRRLGVDEVVGIMEARQILHWEAPSMWRGDRDRVLDRIFGLESEYKDKSKLSGLPGGVNGFGSTNITWPQASSGSGYRPGSQAGGSDHDDSSEGNQRTPCPRAQTANSSEPKCPASDKSLGPLILNIAPEPNTGAPSSALRKQPQLPIRSPAPPLAPQPEPRLHGSSGTSGFGSTSGTTVAFGQLATTVVGSNVFGQTAAGETGGFGGFFNGGFCSTVPTNGTANPAYGITREKEESVTVQFQAITSMPAYRKASFEELRTQDYQEGRKTGGSSRFGHT